MKKLVAPRDCVLVVAYEAELPVLCLAIKSSHRLYAIGVLVTAEFARVGQADTQKEISAMVGS